MSSLVNNVGAVAVSQSVTLSATFTVDEVATDPTIVYFSWDAIGPGGEQLVAKTTWQYGVTGSIAKDGTGLFHVVLTPTLGATWRIRWVGTGTCPAALDGSFVVNSSPLITP